MPSRQRSSWPGPERPAQGDRTKKYWLALSGFLIGLAVLRWRWRKKIATPSLPPANIVWAWGSNASGQLGNPATLFGAPPAPVKGPNGEDMLSDVSAVAAGYEHALALKPDGTVWSWGLNTEGQLGDGTTVNRPIPVQVRGPSGSGFLTGISAIAAGENHSLAVDAQGRVWAWGYNANSQLGDGTTTNSPLPLAVRGPGGAGSLSGIVAVAGGSAHTLALKSDGRVWAWGLNVSGQLGNGSFNINDPLYLPFPALVKGPGGSGFLSGIVSVQAGNSHSLAVNSDTAPSVWSWGQNDEGQLGDGTTTDRSLPVAVSTLGDLGARAAAAGVRHSLAMLYDSVLPIWSWGRNTDGQLGDGGQTSRDVAGQVPGPDLQIVAISAGGDQSLALADDGTVWEWGLHQGNPGLLLLPTQVVGFAVPNSVIAIASGSNFNLAIAPPPPSYQPDLSYRWWIQFPQQDSVSHEWSIRDFFGPWVGEDIYDPAGTGQPVLAGANVSGSQYIIKVRNAGFSNDSFTLTGGSGNAFWKVRYYDAPPGLTEIDPVALGPDWDYSSLPEITTSVTGSGWSTPALPTGGSRDLLMVVVSMFNYQPVGGYPTIPISVIATSNGDSSGKDVIKFSFAWGGGIF